MQNKCFHLLPVLPRPQVTKFPDPQKVALSLRESCLDLYVPSMSNLERTHPILGKYASLSSEA